MEEEEFLKEGSVFMEQMVRLQQTPMYISVREEMELVGVKVGDSEGNG